MRSLLTRWRRRRLAKYRTRRRVERREVPLSRPLSDAERQAVVDLRYARSLVVRALGLSTNPTRMAGMVLVIDHIDAVLEDLQPRVPRPDLVAVPEPEGTS